MDRGAGEGRRRRLGAVSGRSQSLRHRVVPEGGEDIGGAALVGADFVVVWADDVEQGAVRAISVRLLPMGLSSDVSARRDAAASCADFGDDQA